MTFTDYKAIVEFLIDTQKLKPEEAIKAAKVPVHLVDQMRSYLGGPVDIRKATLLVDPKEKLARCGALPDDKQPYFAGLRNFLLNHRRWDRNTIENLAATSTDLVGRIPKPGGRDFKCRGLVVGYIQSGKTASMAALIARAADHGYKLVIVFSGLYRDLRAQTQTRFDQEITSATDIPEERPLVEHDPGTPKWGRLTKSGLQGDFEPGTLVLDILDPKIPKLAVLKKNVKVLERFIAWLKNSQVNLHDLPALIIDDESDLASINTNYGKVDDDGDPIDPSKTNLRIRELLTLFPKCTYVGFTATPFANVLIDAGEDKDLYPKDFIAVLPEPSGYLGPRQLFGLGMQPSDLSPGTEKPKLDAIRYITQEQQQAMDRAAAQGGDCPPLLSEALLSFVLSSCARLQRGQTDKHFSMLVHYSHQTADHNTIAGVVRGELDFLKVALQRPASFKALADSAKTLWEKDFLRATKSLPECTKLATDFASVWRFAKTVVDSIEVKVLNYSSPDQLDYSSSVPRRYIVIGGNRLSRGLTLEGLSVSLFLRDASTYDTLLQMGRWFGFRPNYHDLTRIYVEAPMADQFAALARIEDDLRADLKKYAQEPNPPTPIEVLPRIRIHPIMAVTSPMKMGAAGQVDIISFQGKLSQTVSFPLDEPKDLLDNQRVLREWLKGLGDPDKSVSKDGMHLWKDVPADKVLEMIRAYRFSKYAPDINSHYLSTYIASQAKKGELVRWDIAIPKGNPKNNLYTWTSGLASRMVDRGLATKRSIRALADNNHIREWEKELKRDSKDPALGSLFLYPIDGKSLVQDGQPKLPDTIGLVFNFPSSKSTQPAQYISQVRTRS